MSNNTYMIPDNGGKEVTYMSSNTSPMKQGPGVYFTADQIFRSSDIYGEMYCISVNCVKITGIVSPISHHTSASDVHIYNDQFFASMSQAVDTLNRIYEAYQVFDKSRKIDLKFYPDFEHNRFMVRRNYVKSNTMTLVAYQINKMRHGNFKEQDPILESMVKEEDDA